MLLCIKKNVIKKMLVGFKNVTQAKKKKKAEGKEKLKMYFLYCEK